MSEKRNIKDKAKNLKINFVVVSILYLALGVVLVGWPDITSNVICYAIGAVLLVYGIVSIVTFFTNREKNAALALQLVVGVVAAALGAVFLTQPHLILSIFPVLMGLFIIIASLLSIKRAFEMRRYRYEKWWIAFILALVAIALGVLILFRPYMAAQTVIMVIGVVFLYVGVCDLWAIWKASRLLKEYRKNTPIEVDPIDIE